jgi:aromatic-L-amino-acid/L-tryptophan decarboxylase
MHSVDQTTEQMVRSVLAYAENRLRMNPVPLDQGLWTAPELHRRMSGLIRDTPPQPDEVLGVYTSVIAPSVVSADSPRFLGFIPAAPTKASLLFDMLVSCASIQGISWLEASGAVAAENSVLRVIADAAGLPGGAGGCFVSGGSAGNLSALAVARETAKRRVEAAGGSPRRWRVVVSSDAHSSITNTLRLLEMDALVVATPDHRLTPHAVEAALAREADLSDVAAVVCTSGTTNAGIIDDLAGVGTIAREQGWWFHVDGAYGGAGLFAPTLRERYAGIELADSFILDPHKWLFTPFDCCALLYRDPALARTTHAQDASYLDVIHTGETAPDPGGTGPAEQPVVDPASAEWNPTDYAYHLTRRARGLPLWFSMAVHGLDAYADAIEVAVRLARETADLVKATPHLQLVREPDLGIVLFRRVGWRAEDYDRWSRGLHRDEVAFVPPSQWDGETVGRLAFLHPDTSMETVREVLARTA